MTRRTQSGHRTRLTSTISGENETFDIVVMADMSRAGDVGLRIAQEVRTFLDLGYRTGLAHLPSRRSSAIVSPDIQRCLRDRSAEVIDPEWTVRARLVIVHSPGLFAQVPEDIGRLQADRVVLVHDRPPEAKQIGRWFGFLFGAMSWAPTNRWVRGAIEDLRLPMPVEAEDWRPVGRRVEASQPRRRDGSRLAIGCICPGERAQWPENAEELAEIFPTDGSMDVYFLGAPPADLMPRWRGPAKWTSFAHGDIAVERFLGLIDALVYFPSGEFPELPDAAISAAMASGKIVVLPPRLKPHFGPGAVYCEPAELVGSLTGLVHEPDAWRQAREATAYHAAFQFSENAFRERIADLVPPRSQRRRATSRKSRPKARRVLLVPSNGVGLGHVTRLLAIARRAAGRFDPIFATMARAVPVIESFGYATEYIPSRSDTGADLATWDAWFRIELERLIERHDVDLVVFDGNNPTQGLIHAVLSHAPCKLAWVRRGMGGATPSPFLDNARFCDLIIEPGELASERDVGPTAERRHEVKIVKPIRLLDENELLSREDAAAALELDARRPAVLVHLGADATRDLLAAVDTAVAKLKQFPGMQIVIAEWANGQMPLSLWPDTRTISGFPICQYFNAFDFSIAAAGYNTFHEVIGFELPTIFIANAHPSLDNQIARAQFAQDVGAGLDLPEAELFHLPAICDVLLDERARAVVRQNCRRIRQENGAAEAADALAELVGVV